MCLFVCYEINCPFNSYLNSIPILHTGGDYLPFTIKQLNKKPFSENADSIHIFSCTKSNQYNSSHFWKTIPREEMTGHEITSKLKKKKKI